MNNGLLAMKELYDVFLKATYPIEIGDKRIEEGETIALFDKIQIANINELKDKVSARGGFDNRAQVTWETTREVNINFSQGVFSKTQLALLSNSKMIENKEQSSILIPKRELVESDESGKITFSKVPSSFFIYDKNTGEKITNYTKESDTVYNITDSYKDVILDYNFTYTNPSEQIIVGKKLIQGYVRLEGKTRFKDDSTGNTYTGLFVIPRLKLMSDLSIRLGTNVNPMVANFSATGYPIGARGNTTVMELYFLSDDIDSDI